MNLFDLAAKITLDTGDFEAKIKSAVGNVQELSGAIGNGLANAAKIGMAAVTSAMAGIGALTKSAVDGFAEYEQLVGGVETLFKDSAGVVREYAANAYNTAGLSANDYMDTVTSFSASLIQSLGGNTAEAAEIADMAITDMADNANKMGTDIASIQNAYQGFAKQNYTMLDNLKLGYGGTKDEMQRLLDKASELSGIKFDISSFADISQAIHIIQKDLGIANATLEESATTIEGSINSMKAAWKNLITGLANPDADLGLLAQNFAESFETAFYNVEPAIETALMGIGEMIARVAPVIIEKLPDLGGALLDSLTNVVESVAGIDLTPVVDSIKNALGGLMETVQEFGAAFQDGGIGGVFDLIVGAFEGLTGIDLSPIIDGISDFVGKIKEEAPAAIESFKQALQGFKDKLDELGLGDLINTVAEKVGEFIGKFDGAAVIQTAADAVKWLGDNLEWIAPLFVGVVAGIAAYNAITMVASTVTTVATIAATAFRMAMALLNAVLNANPIALVVTLIAGLIAAFITAYQTSDEFREKVDKAFAAIKEAIGNAVDAIAKFFGETLPSALSSAVDAIKTKVSEFIQAGKDLIGGFVQGIKDKVSDAVAAVKEAAGNVIDGVKNVLGIHSPSRVFAEIGKNLILGLEQGFNSEFKTAENSMLGSFNSLVGGMNGTARINFAESGIGKASVGTVNGIMAAASQGGSYNINLVVDGKTLAGVVYDPLNKIIKQKGEAAYA